MDKQPDLREGANQYNTNIWSHRIEKTLYPIFFVSTLNFVSIYRGDSEKIQFNRLFERAVGTVCAENK